jgi:hypothetical protein
MGAGKRSLATVVIGGLITATALTLLLIPGVYALVHRRGGSREAALAAEMRLAENGHEQAISFPAVERAVRSCPAYGTLLNPPKVELAWMRSSSA